MAKTRSSSASCSSPHRPRRSSASIAPLKHKRKRRTVAMAEKKKKLRCQVSVPLTSTDERGNKGSGTYPKLELQNSTPHHSCDRKPKTASKDVARKSVRCYKTESPAAYCSRKTYSKQSAALLGEGCFERNSNSCKRSQKVGSSKVRISESPEACTEERSCEQPKGMYHDSGWASEQDVALQSAYFQVRPSSNFWVEVSKKVPGKTAKDCFDRFYSAHPTPPTTQPRSKKISADSPLRTISFASPMASLNCKGRFGRGKQGLLKAHQTVRHMLRQQRVADGSYEADVFSAVEQLNPKDSLLHNCISTTILPSPALRSKDSESPVRTPATCSRYAKSGDEVWWSTSSHLRTRFDHDQSQHSLKSASQISLLSPEVLKAEQNPSRLDRFLDILHLRRVHKRKSASLKGLSQSQEHMNAERSSTHCVAAAREAILMDAKEVLRTSLQQKSAVEEETSFSSDHTEDESSLLSE